MSIPCHRGHLAIVVLGCCAIAGFNACISKTSAQEPEAILLWPAGAPGALGDKPEDKPRLFPYPAAADNNTGAAIVVCPGGGYGGLAISYEGHDIARWLNGFGVSAFVLDYRHRGKGYGHPAPLQDAQRAIRTVRARAGEWKINPERVGILGFSAGGHLASSAGVHFVAGEPEAADTIERVSSRPDFLVLCYPVIAFAEPFTHTGSQKNLLGENAASELVREMSSEKQVTSETPPTFLWHTTEDAGVPPENSISFYLALRKAGVPAELHIYEKGRHGLGLAADMLSVQSWPKSCEDWLRGRGYLNTK